MRGRTVAILLLLLLMLSGCVYFNTFYLARRYFRDAEEIRVEAERQDRPLPNQARQAYGRSLQFATKVLAEHPESKWVEEALVLSQKALYYQDDLAASTRKGQELIQNFPQSPWIHEARLFLARGYLGLGENLNAAGQAQQAAEALTGRLRAEALLVRAQALEAEGLTDEAAGTLQELIASPETPSDLIVSARLAHAELLDHQGAYGEAAAVLTDLLADVSLPRSIRTETVVNLIDLLIKAEDLEAAEEWVGRLGELDSAGYYKGVLGYYRGVFAWKRGSRRQAIQDITLSLLDGVTPEWEARIRLDLARLMEDGGTWISAVPEYRMLNAGLGTAPQRQEALGRYNAIARLFALRALVARTEEGISFSDPRGRAEVARPGAPRRRLPPRAGNRPPPNRVNPDEEERIPRRAREGGPAAPTQGELVKLGDVPPGVYLYLLAEHFAQEMGRPDSAAAYLAQLVRRHPDSDLVPRALFAMWEWAPQDQEGRRRAQAAAERLTKEFADTRWAYYHLRRIGEDPPKPGEIRADEALLEIEEKIDPLADPGSWAALLPELYGIAERFAGTGAAGRAELIAASLLERGAGEPDSARSAYQRVVDRYPGTEQARIAARRLAAGRGLAAPAPEDARRQVIEQEMRSWGTWFGTLTAAKVTRLQPRGAGTRVATMPAAGARAGQREEIRRANRTRPPPPPSGPSPPGR